MTPTPFMILWKRPEVLLPFYAEIYHFPLLRKNKIQGHYQLSQNLVKQYHFRRVFKHEKTFGAVVLVIGHSCYEIRLLNHMCDCIFSG